MRIITLLAAAGIAAMLTLPAAAQPVAGKLTLELNALAPTDGACRMTLVATNGLGTAIDHAAFEMAFFGQDGVISQLASLDFKALPLDKTKVLQFDLAGLDCAGVTRVLVNDVTTCDGAGLDPAACLDKLATTTKTSILFGT